MLADLLALLWAPFLMCLVLTGIHAYLGVHVLAREVVFVDIALAQIAALGATAAFLFGHELSTWESYAAGAVLLSDRAAHGVEHIRTMLVGSLLTVSGADVVKVAILYGAIGVVHWACRRPFFLISTDPQKAYAQGWRVRLWDFVFYVSFGVVVTSSVRIAGVLLVFSYLIVPALAATLVCGSVATRLLVGWAFGAAVSVLGVTLSAWLDLPTGATIVCVFGVSLIALWAAVKLRA